MCWIKLHTKIKDWRWWGDSPTMCVWIHILIEANWKDKPWKNITVPRGSLVTSVANLADSCGLTTKQTRRALDNLVTSGEIEKFGANKWTIIKVCKYDSYQVSEDASGQTKGKQRANKGQQPKIDRKIDSNNINNNSLSVKSEGLTPRERELIFDIFFYKFGTRAAEELERFTDHYQSQGWTKNRGTRVTNKVILSKSWESKSDNKGDIPEQFLRCLKLVNRRLGLETTPLTKIMAVKVTDDELYISARESDGVFQFIEDNAKIIGCAIRRAYKQKIIYDYRK